MKVPVRNVQIPWSLLYTYCLFLSPFWKEIISQNENDVVIEDIFERSSTTQRNVSNENIEEEDGAESEGTSDKNGHVVKHEVFQNKDCIDQDMDPKIRKGLKKIQKLDAILADKLQVTIPLTSKFLHCLTYLHVKGHLCSNTSPLLFTEKSQMYLTPNLSIGVKKIFQTISK